MRFGLLLALAFIAVVHEAATSGRPLRLADATDFEWERFYAVPPYSSPAAIERQLGFE